ncbi:glycosyltransferase [Coleofasciculus sp.]|uniref:glycosyltransferase n=1 Tax=Coleofasciculus sp. TaxID=3100458 RepID=UPI003A34F80E
MRIAFIVGQFPVLSETFILNQIIGVIDRGHEVDIYADHLINTLKVHPDVENYRLLERTYQLTQIPNNLIWRVIKGLGLLLVNFHKSPRFLLESLNVSQHGLQAASLWLMYSAISLMHKQAYDIIHCQFGTQGYRGMFFKNVLHSQPKLIVMFRGHDISRYVQEHGDRVYDEIFKSGDFFLANCEFFRQRVIQLGGNPERVAVHRSGLDCSKFKFIPRQLNADGIIRIATTGRLVEKKGIEYAIRAVAQQAQVYPQLEYQIIGDGILKEHLQTIIQALNAESFIKLVGWKREQEIIEILEQSHLFIAPSITAQDGNQDAPINVLKEAMAMGLPVISTYHGGIPELVEDGVSGFLVPESNAEALAEKLGYLIEHPERWSEMGQAGRAYVEQHYDIHRLNDKLVQLYQQLLETDNLAVRSQPALMEPSHP